MIELRWLIDKRSDAHRVLQWRHQRTVLVQEMHETGDRLKRREEWSPWAPVPEVVESDMSTVSDSPPPP